MAMMAQEDPDPRKYATYLATRPVKFERDAAHMLIDVLLEEHIPPTPGFFLHIAHLGDAANIEGFRVRSGGGVELECLACYKQFLVLPRFCVRAAVAACHPTLDVRSERSSACVCTMCVRHAGHQEAPPTEC